MDLLKYNLKTEALVESQDFGLDNKEKTVATTENETIIELPLSKIKPWKDENGNKQPFLIDPEELSRLKKSIQNVGRVIQPIVVTPYENEYEIISGHKRVRACQELCIGPYLQELLKLTASQMKQCCLFRQIHNEEILDLQNVHHVLQFMKNIEKTLK